MPLLKTMLDWSPLSLVIIAIIGIYIAYKNISILREQNRSNTFLTLMAEISGQVARDNRQIIHNSLKNLKQELIVDNIKYYTSKDGYTDSWDGRVAHAFEETIVMFDRLGFFLLRGDPKLIDEAPTWLWDITSEMWDNLGEYVDWVQKNESGRYNYGKYFKKLAKKAETKQQQSTAKK
jgi:hypothetical protein